MKRKTLGITAIVAVLVLSLGMFTALAVEQGHAPIAENLEISTYRDVSVDGRLKACDSDGDVLHFEITTSPTKGKLVLSEDGKFVYTPDKGKKGKDYFGYKVIDKDGNKSAEATVIITIEKQKTTIRYSDMAGNGSECAAIALAEKEIFVGECLGGQYVFMPSATVTRGEFLAMCLKLTDTAVLSGVITTGFADDGDIPGYQKPYVSTALLTGIISGYSDGRNTAVFSGGNAISYPEAAVMLNKSLRLSNVSLTNYLEATPAWATQACANLSACRISDFAGETQLTRADSAKLIYGAMKVLDKR